MIFKLIIFIIVVCIGIFAYWKDKDKKETEKYRQKYKNLDPNNKTHKIEFYLEDVNIVEAKKIYNSVDYQMLTFEPYKDNTRYKVMTEDSEILGEVPIEYVGIIKKNQPDLLFDYVDKKLNNEGKIEYTVKISFNV